MRMFKQDTADSPTYIHLTISPPRHLAISPSLHLAILLCWFIGLVIPLWGQQAALPITTYDYAIPENNVSPVAMGTAAMNLTNSDDPFVAYNNPALLADNQLSSFSVSFRLRNPEDIAFWEAANIGNTLKSKQFKYFVLTSKMVSFGYQPVASVHLSEIAAGGSSKYYDYQLDKVQVSLGGKDKKYNKLGAGASVKYLSGRLVYLAEHVVGNNMLVRDAFIDDKVKGFSTDLGFTYDAGNFTYAGCVYDLFSRLWWENYDSVSITRRMSTEIGYDSGNSHFNAGVQNRISRAPDTTYHLGYGHTWNFGGSQNKQSNTRQTLDLRLGAYSKDFYGADNINYTFGGGYYHKTIRFDFSLNNRGMKLADSEYLFAVSLGI